jgi:alkyl hydroperoxide reductase 1
MLAKVCLSPPFPFTTTLLYLLPTFPSPPSTNPQSRTRINLTELLHTEWANKKVVLFSVPGAFTPSCSAKHLPGYIENLSAIKAKGVDIVAVVAFNDAWVMSAWGKANGVKGDDIVRSPL